MHGYLMHTRKDYINNGENRVSLCQLGAGHLPLAPSLAHQRSGGWPEKKNTESISAGDHLKSI